MTPERLKALRTEWGLSQQALGEWVGYGPGRSAKNNIGKFERGGSMPTAISKLLRYREKYGDIDAKK